MEALSVIWNEAIIRPMLNTLMVLYVISFSQMGIAIILLTVLVRVVTLPLTLKQVRQMRAMSTLQPRMREIQERYRNDRARVSQETMRMYREAGVNPIGCLGPLVVQMPILIGLFRVLIQTVFSKPDDLVGLSDKLYNWIPLVNIHAAAPLNATFIWLDPRSTRSIDGGHPRVGFCLYLGPTKDDHDAVHRPAAAVQPDYDALDDAADDRILFPSVPKRPITLLDRLKRHWYRHPVFRNRVGSSIPAVPQGARSTGAPGALRAGSG